MRLDSDKAELADIDEQNSIQGAPPKVRALPENLQSEPIIIDDHICA